MNKAASVRKEFEMEEMNQAEVAREETEEKMIYKFLLMIKESKDLEELEQRQKPYLTSKQGSAEPIRGRYLPPPSKLAKIL